MKIISIAAVAKNGVIGKGSALPWDLPEDMKFFKDSTRNHIVVMGRKTYEALGHALPKRENAVISRDLNLKLPDARVFQALEMALQFYQGQKELQNKTLFIIGGAEIYSLAMPFVDEIWITEIHENFEGDIYFPDYRNGQFERPEFSQTLLKEQVDLISTPIRFQILRYARKMSDQ